ncbi:extracellular membrane protein, CFEM domain protein [Rhodotorula toruloides]|uniref:Extracellular membrane protein, CFEM domain protein n=1 Tax=Rhodotorula toruloides TaxID=5286 RepID=A0A511KPQ0_RHOTO|nr:extracellular membrane protein, CFEM domain protein [Rhodotorula toruloides]
MKTTTAAVSLAAFAGLAFAQPPANAPVCATRCFTTKIMEAGQLAPGVSPTDIAGLCRSVNFVQAYVNCLGDHCTGNNYATGIQLGQAVCANVGASLPSTGVTGSATDVLRTLSAVPVSSGSQTASVAASFSSALAGAAGGSSGASMSGSSMFTGASSTGAGAMSSGASGASSATSGAAGAASTGVSGASGAASTATSGAGGVGSTVTSGAGGAASTVTSGAGGVLSTVTSGAGGAVSTATGAAGSAASAATGGAKNAGNNLFVPTATLLAAVAAAIACFA